jgi:hypothetical protein
MNRREKLQFYMQEKNYLIEYLTGLELYQEEDYDFPWEMETEDIQEFFLILVHFLERAPGWVGPERIIGSTACPQCHKWLHGSGCIYCTYSQAPCCTSEGSRWEHIRERTCSSPSSQKRAKELLTLIRWNKLHH